MSDTFCGVPEADLRRLGRIAHRLLTGSPNLPHGTSPRRLRAGHGIEFLELRSYMPGDEPRDIDWRATARSRHPLVRRYQDEAFSTVWLCLDRSASMGASNRDKWKLAVQIAVALAYLLLYAGNRVGLLAFSAGLDVVCPPGRGRTCYARLLARLAATEVRTGGGASRLEACARVITTGASAVVLSDFLAPDFLRPGLAQLLGRGAHVQAIQVLSPSEVAAEGVEHAVLRDVETGERRTVWLTEAVTHLAARRLGELRDELAGYCRSRGIPFSPCDTRMTWRDAILAHLRSLAPFHA